MSLELPVVSAVIARLPNPEINLAAYGGVIFPIALIVESPIIMLLAASTALSRDWESYARLRRFMLRMGMLLTALHLLVALTPLYYVVVNGLIGAPPEIVEPSRIGLLLMTPWAWSIAFRRFNQGVLIRFEHSRVIGVGTGIRLGTEWLTLAAGYLVGTVPGNIVGPGAVALGVMSEAAYIGLRVRPVVRGELRDAPAVTPLAFGEFVAFYVPLALTSFLNLFVQPLGSAALSRMPLALASLAAWPVVSGFSFVFRSPGVAYNEVVVALLDEPGAVRRLRRFAWMLGGAVSALILGVVATPLVRLWLRELSALPPALVDLSRPAMWLVIPMPLLLPLQSYFQGALVNSRRTRGVTEAIVVFLVVTAIVLVGGVMIGGIPGLHVGLAAFTLATAAQTGWLWVRSRPVLAAREVAEVGEVTAATAR
jgi:hypothetical protein